MMDDTNIISFGQHYDSEEFEFNLELGGLDITTEEIDFDEVGDDLAKFQQDDIVKEALAKGVDLRNYSRQIEKELRVVESFCIDDFLKEGDSIAELHGQIRTCDTVLESMQAMLNKFNNNLCSISTEIKDIQIHTLSMSTKMKNRQEVEKELGAFIKAIYISEDLAKLITDGEINQDYANALQTMSTKLQNLKDPYIVDTQAAQDVIAKAQKLQITAISRIRVFLLNRFNDMKKMQTNIQIQQTLLHKCSYCYHFLVLHSTEVDNHLAKEIRDIYIDIVSKVYYNKFKTCFYNLKKVQKESFVLKKDLLGTDESKTGGLFSTKRTTADLARVFTLGQRDHVLMESESTYILPHVSQHDGKRYPYQVIFQSMQRLLMDISPTEHNFICQFFFGKSVDKKKSQKSSLPTAGIPDIPVKELKSANVLRVHLEETVVLYTIKLTSVTGKLWTVEKRYSSFILLHESITNESPNIAKKMPPLPKQKYHFSFASHLDKEHDEILKIALKNYLTAIVDLYPFSNSLQQFFMTDDAPNTSFQSQSSSEKNERQIKWMFTQIFSKTFSLFYESLEDFLSTCCDSIGLLILIRIVCQQNQIMQANDKHFLDGFFDHMKMSLWPRFKNIFDINRESISKIKACPVKKTYAQPPIYVTSRYASYVAAIRILNRGYNDEILSSNLLRLRDEMEKLFHRTAGKILIPKSQLVFLINNYQLIISILQKNRVESEETLHFRELSASKIKMYVDSELSEEFGDLIKCVKHIEQKFNNFKGKDPTKIGVDYDAIESVVNRFARRWRDGIGKLNGNVMKSFPFEPDESLDSGSISVESMGSEILRKVLIQLVLYYQKFQDLIKKVYKGRPLFSKNLISIQTIMYEIKKYGPR